MHVGAASNIVQDTPSQEYVNGDEEEEEEDVIADEGIDVDN
jgi:hypothetical protein